MEKKCENCKVKNLPAFDKRICENCMDNPNYKAQTNRQKYFGDNVSDEELAKYIRSKYGCCSYCIYDATNECNGCTSGILQWLQAEHKE